MLPLYRVPGTARPARCGRLRWQARTQGNEDDTAKTDDAKLRPILSSKLFLYVTEFFSGMGVMAAELGASRLLIVTVSTNFPVIAALAACRPS